MNNAGIGITDNTSGLTDSTVDDWHLFMDTNAMAHFLGMKHIVPEMKKIGGGSIINIFVPRQCSRNRWGFTIHCI